MYIYLIAKLVLTTIAGYFLARYCVRTGDLINEPVDNDIPIRLSSLRAKIDKERSVVNEHFAHWLAFTLVALAAMILGEGMTGGVGEILTYINLCFLPLLSTLFVVGIVVIYRKRHSKTPKQDENP